MQFAKSAAVVVIAAAASGGIALAAASPGGAPSRPGRVLPSIAASQAQEHAAVPLSTHPSGKPAKPVKSHGKSGSQGHPNPNLNGLCHAWMAGAGSKHGKARNSPAFQALIRAAGGSGNVAAYCATVIKTHPSDDASDEPGDDADDSTEASAPSHPDKTTHPKGRPDVIPSASHPKGAPSNVPAVTSPGHS
jgi:hypothetical protein